MRTSLLVWLALFVVWLLLVGSLAAAEVTAGVVAAAIATIGVHAVRTRDDASFVFPAAYFAILARRLPRQVVLETGYVAGALVSAFRRQSVHGRMVEIPFDPGSPDDAADGARRALVVAGASLPPNSVVVRLEPHAVLMHQLVHVPPPPGDPRWPL